MTTNTNVALLAALEAAHDAIIGMKVEAETAAQGDEQMMLEACEQISNEGLEATTAIRAALTTAAAVPAAGMVTVPEVPDERMERAIAAAFFGTVHEARKAWVAGIAAAPKAEPAPAEEYPPLPEPYDVGTGGGAAFSGQQMRAYGEACWKHAYKHAAWAQAAPIEYDHGPKAATIEEAARDVGKWLNERPNRPLDLRSVAMLTAYAQAAPAAVAGPSEAPEGWRNQFAEAVYADLEAADNQDVPLEEYPTRILKALDSIVGPRHPTVIHWRNDAIQACIAIAYKYCRDPESFQYLKQDIQALIFAAPTTQAAPQPAVQQRDDLAELQRLADCCPELNERNYDQGDVEELNAWAVEVAQCIDRALAAHPAAPVAQGDALTYEQQWAIRQGHEIAASDSYFDARPQIDNNDRRKVFEAGFERGWDAARSQAKKGGAW